MGWTSRSTKDLASNFWPKMWEDVDDYVHSYLVCQQDKVDHQRLDDLLKPLSVPSRPWESVTMNFISVLPKVGKLESIMVIMDRFS